MCSPDWSLNLVPDFVLVVICLLFSLSLFPVTANSFSGLSGLHIPVVAYVVAPYVS